MRGCVEKKCFFLLVFFVASACFLTRQLCVGPFFHFVLSRLSCFPWSRVRFFCPVRVFPLAFFFLSGPIDA